MKDEQQLSKEALELVTEITQEVAEYKSKIDRILEKLRAVKKELVNYIANGGKDRDKIREYVKQCEDLMAEADDN